MFTPSSIAFLKPVKTTDYAVVTIAELTNQIQAWASKQFTGRLDLKSDKTQDQEWSLYFYRGDLIWATSKVHPIGRWYRQLSWYCPKLVASQESNLSQLPDYDSLVELVRQEKIQREQLEAVVEGQIREILFDIVQWGEKLCYRSRARLVCREITTNSIDSTLFAIPADETWRHALKFWDAWQRAGLEDCSPNEAPVILNAEELQRETSQLVYRNLTTLADSHRTFRDLAVKLNRNLLLLTQPVMPLIRKGLMGLIEVEDFSGSGQPVTATNPKEKKYQSRLRDDSFSLVSRQAIAQAGKTLTLLPLQPTGSLVAYIDDSQIDRQTMSKILTESGYRCINIQDALQTLPILLEHKPDLIFLDLVMPIANGYEICAQIRRISAFKDTPVIILTSNDGILDRVRAKIVGSSGFLAKPITSEKVLNALKTHLRDLKPVQSDRK
jgi:chemotaxis family two-component system response regulator PixG